MPNTTRTRTAQRKRPAASSKKVVAKRKESVIADHVGKYILAIDLGTSSAKVALVSERGEVVGWEGETLQLFLLPGGGAEQDPEDWWTAVVKSAKRLLAKRLVPAEAVVAVCASTQGEGTVPVDLEGNCLTRCHIWLDARGAALVRNRVGSGLAVAGYELVKLQRYLRLTGGAPSLSGKDRFGHMLFIKREMPEVYAQTYKFLDVLDYIDLRLTGQFLTSTDSVVGTWMTDNRNPGSIHYDPQLVRWGEIDAEKLPNIRRSIDVLGPLKAEVADELGLGRDVKVVTGAFDVPAAAVGSGAARDYEAHLYLGTSSWVGVHTPFMKTDVFHSMASLPCANPDRFLLMAAQETAGGNLTFLRDNLLYHKDRLLGAVRPGDYFAALNEVAADVPAGSRGLIYTPWLYGERAPVDDPWVRAGIHNLSLDSTRSDIVRAMLEGVAYNTRWIFVLAEKFCGRRLDAINMVGGGASSDVWCQIQADVLNRTVRQVRDPVQSNAVGAAFIAWVGLGFIRFEDIPSLVRIQKEYQPNPDHRKLYDGMYAEFLQLYKATHAIYGRLNSAGSPRGA